MKFEKLTNSILNEGNSTSTNINIDAIEKIESNGNPRAVGKAGEHGAVQILNQKTWDWIVQNMGKSWSWLRHSFDRNINKAVGDHYINVIIPKQLNTFKIPDTNETRIAAYNWGIGNLKNAYRSDPQNWQESLPTSTTNYINKYYSLVGKALTPPVTPQVTPQVTVIGKSRGTLPPRGSKKIVHVIEPGDTIEDISMMYKVSMEDLQAKNPQIKDINRVNVGDIVNIS